MQNLEVIPGDTPVRDVYSIPRAAKAVGLTASTLYRGVDSDQLKVYQAPNLGNKQPEIVVLLADAEKFRDTRRKNKRRAEKAKELAPEPEEETSSGG